MTTRQDIISLARLTRDSASLFVKDIGNGLLVDTSRTDWEQVRESGSATGWWVEFPALSLRQIAG